MKLKGSCQCGGVAFRVETKHPVPYQRCYCSICRKMQGGGGYAVNLSADRASLSVTGADKVTTYRATMREPGKRARKSKSGAHLLPRLRIGPVAL